MLIDRKEFSFKTVFEIKNISELLISADLPKDVVAKLLVESMFPTLSVAGKAPTNL
jgi:hypothetical protein